MKGATGIGGTDGLTLTGTDVDGAWTTGVPVVVIGASLRKGLGLLVVIGASLCRALGLLVFIGASLCIGKGLLITFSGVGVNVGTGLNIGFDIGDVVVGVGIIKSAGAPDGAPDGIAVVSSMGDELGTEVGLKTLGTGDRRGTNGATDCGCVDMITVPGCKEDTTIGCVVVCAEGILLGTAIGAF